MVKTLITLALSFAAAVAHAAPLTPDKTARLLAHCECEMRSDSCILMTRRPMEAAPTFLRGYGLVQPADANYLTIAGDSMCAAAARELAKDSTSARGMVARARWRQEWAGPCPYPPRPVAK